MFLVLQNESPCDKDESNQEETNLPFAAGKWNHILYENERILAQTTQRWLHQIAEGNGILWEEEEDKKSTKDIRCMFLSKQPQLMDEWSPLEHLQFLSDWAVSDCLSYLNSFALSEVIHKKSKHLDATMKRQLHLALALSQHHDILFLHEALEGLSDALLRTDISRLQSYMEQETCILLYLSRQKTNLPLDSCHYLNALGQLLVVKEET